MDNYIWRKIKVFSIAVMCLAIWILSGCSMNSTKDIQPQNDDTVMVETDSDEKSELSETESDYYKESIDESEEQEPKKNESDSQEISEIDLDDVPEYSGESYISLNNNIPEFSDEDKNIMEPFENYSSLDNLGRCGVAYANICTELMPTEERGSIGQIKPSGWHTVKYNDLIDGNYLYNRCHLIGYQLAGENANELNLITGTRYLNVVSMLEFENIVSSYVQETDNHVLYRVTPWFDGDNLVATGVQIEAWSIEDQGAGVCFNVFCYNVQPGIEIDYATGDSWISTDSENVSQFTQTDNEVEQNTEGSLSTDQQEVGEYVLNLNTKKFHLPTCSSVDDMADHNKKIVTGTIDEIMDEGYTPCARCLSNYR